MVVFLVVVRNKIYRKVMYGFYGTITVSFFVLMIQGIHGQTSFTVSTFLYPVLAMMYFLHSNPYDANLGSVDSSALEERVRFYHERGIEFAYVSFQLCLFDDEQRELPDEFRTLIREFSTRYFRNGMLFQISKGHSVLIFIKKRNKDYEERFCRMKEAFRKEYEKFRLDYKFLIGSSIDEISEKNEYISFIRGIMRKMDVNTIHRVDRSDIDHFKKAEYIRKELGDIYRKRDMDDPRVLVYCQPVYNIRTGKYDTAEALMRLKLNETGLVFPDWFIPMAEESGFIHVLTQIMLHKTCLAVSELVRTGYDLKRVSVNVSVLELKEEDFCRNIEQIIEESGVESERIAIELTESRNENDFALMKQKIDELKDMGIKFYLDDFGTGYSNMERIMELPFDIIKFDRSLVLACESSERSHTLVLSLANMFASMQYAVLYEGVEEESDEKMCMEMFASYLQGYRYSRPIPIGELRNYCSR